MGYTCPATYNPADFYVQTLAVIPGLEDTSRSTVRAICDRFIVTSTAKQIDLLIQFETSLGQEMLELSTKNGHQPVGLWEHFILHFIKYRMIKFIHADTKHDGRFSFCGWSGELLWIPIAIQPFTLYESSKKSYASKFVPVWNRLFILLCVFAGYRSSSWTLFSRRTRHQRSKDNSKYSRRFIHFDNWKHVSGSLRRPRYFSDGVAAVLERCARGTLFTFCLLSL